MLPRLLVELEECLGPQGGERVLDGGRSVYRINAETPGKVYALSDLAEETDRRDD